MIIIIYVSFLFLVVGVNGWEQWDFFRRGASDSVDQEHRTEIVHTRNDKPSVSAGIISNPSSRSFTEPLSSSTSRRSIVKRWTLSRDSQLEALLVRHKKIVENKILTPISLYEVENHRDYRVDKIFSIADFLSRTVSTKLKSNELLQELVDILVQPSPLTLEENKALIEEEEGNEDEISDDDDFPDYIIVNSKMLLQGDFSTVVKIYQKIAFTFKELNKLEDACDAYAELLKIDLKNLNVIYERASILGKQLKRYAEGAAEMDKMITLGGVSVAPLELYYEKATMEFEMRDLVAARRDYMLATERKSLTTANDNARGICWHMKGICEKDLGFHEEAIASMEKGLKLNSPPTQAYTDIGAAYTELGDWRKALVNLEKTLQIDRNNLLALFRKGIVNQRMGRYEHAIVSFEKGLTFSRDMNFLIGLATSYFCIGNYFEAAKYYEQILAIDKKHSSLFKKELLYYIAYKAHSPLHSYSPDVELESVIRIYSTQVSDSILPMTLTSYSKRKGYQISRKPLFKPSQEFTDSASYLLVQTSVYSSWISLNSPGFVPNQRMFAVFGLSVLQIVQSLTTHVQLLKHGKVGLTVTDSSISKANYYGSKSCSFKSNNCPQGHHIFGWRDFFEIAVRWRRICEPLDTVWWLDTLPLASTTDERLNVKTFMLTNGHTRNFRYYTYFEKSFALAKELILTRGYAPVPAGWNETFFDPTVNLKYVSDAKKERVKGSKTVLELSDVLGEMFHVSIPLNRTSRILGGGTLFLVHGNAFGPNFGIKFASNDKRYQQFEPEIHRIFENMVNFMVTNTLGLGDEQDQRYQDTMATFGLELFYYWNNFAPLSRGASAVGYVIFYACVLASGAEISENIPRKKQLDFEAFLSRSFLEFRDKVWPIVMKRKKTSLGKALISPVFSLELSTGTEDDGGGGGSSNDMMEVGLDGDAFSISDVNDEELLISLPIPRSNPKPRTVQSEPLLLPGKSLLVSDVFNTAAAITYALANLDSLRPIPEAFKP